MSADWQDIIKKYERIKTASLERPCGESDHDLNEIDKRDGLTAYECRTCGAEIVTEDW